MEHPMRDYGIDDADELMHRESQDRIYMQPNGRKRNPHAHPYPGFGMHPDAEFSGMPSPPDHPGTGYGQPGPSRIPVGDPFEHDMRQRGPRLSGPQRRRSSRRDPRMFDRNPLGSSAGVSRSHTSGSRSGRRPSFTGWSGGPEYMDGPRQRREGRTPD